MCAMIANRGWRKMEGLAAQIKIHKNKTVIYITPNAPRAMTLDLKLPVLLSSLIKCRYSCMLTSADTKPRGCQKCGSVVY